MLKTLKNACGQPHFCYYTHMTENDIMTRPTDTYFVVTAASYADSMTRWLVGGGSDQQQAIAIAESVVSGVVDGFTDKAEAFESYPELAPPTKKWLAITAAADEHYDGLHSDAVERCREADSE